MIASFTTDRRHGHARHPQALRRILRSKKLPVSAATAEQVHGSSVRVVPQLREPRVYRGADGLITAFPGQPLGIFTADCLPVFLSAQDGRVVGILHAGWRGLRSGILKKAVSILRKKWGLRPPQIKAWTGPAIGPCCFEVQWDVAKFFPLSRQRKKDRWSVDLAGELRRQAQSLGLRWVRQAPADLCTMHHQRFYSYRRNKTQNRQVSIIMRTVYS